MCEGQTSALTINGTRLDFPIQRPFFSDSVQNAPEANYSYLSKLHLKGRGGRKPLK